jgi:hypothetical protein
MTEYLTADDVANDIRMCRSGFSGTIVVVEGDTDQTVFERLLDSELCQILPANNKGNAFAAFASLSSSDNEGVIVIVDADFDRYLNAQAAIPGVFLSDCHDLEMMMLESPAFDSVLGELSSPRKVQRTSPELKGPSVRDIIYTAVLPIGILRLISITDNLGLDFEEMNYRKIVSRDLRPDPKKIVHYVIQFSKNRSRAERLNRLDYRAITERVGEVAEGVTRPDILELCCGHDAAAAFCIALKHLLGSRQGSSHSVETVERSLRLAFDVRCFVKSRLYGDLRDWESQQNGRYAILRN